MKLINRDTAIAVCETDGNALVVWNQSNSKKQEFGRIWAAELVRQPNGTYKALEPFLVSKKSGSNQRPAVQYVPAFGVYMIVWDTGPREPKTTYIKSVRKHSGYSRPSYLFSTMSVSEVSSMRHCSPSSYPSSMPRTWKVCFPGRNSTTPCVAFVDQELSTVFVLLLVQKALLVSVGFIATPSTMMSISI